MKYEHYVNGNHCFYWGKNGFWIVNEKEVENFKKMVKEWKAENIYNNTPVDYEFCYSECLDWFALQDWCKIPLKKKIRILEYLARQA